MKRVRTIDDIFADPEWCSDCGSMIDEGEDVYEDDNGNPMCEDCAKYPIEND